MTDLAPLQLNREALALVDLLARILGGTSQRGHRRIEIGLQPRVRIRRQVQFGRQLLRQRRDLGCDPGLARARLLRRLHRRGQRGGQGGRRWSGFQGRRGQRHIVMPRLLFAQRPGVRNVLGQRVVGHRFVERGVGLARFVELLVQGAAKPDAGSNLGDVLFETALHLRSSAASTGPASFSFAGSPMRSLTSSRTAWMSCAPLLSAS